MSLPLSLSEICYYRSGFVSGVRVDGRSLMQKRQSMISVNTLKHTPGSASITIDGTSILIAIQAKFCEQPTPIQFLVDYAPSAKIFQPETIAAKCALLQELLTSAYASMREFQVGSSTGYWHLNADVMVRMRSFPHQVLNDAGNIFEAAFDSLAAALSSTRLPKSISDVGGIYPEDLVPLSIPAFPSLKYTIMVNNILAADPTIEEESISDAQLFLTRSSDDEISSVRKLGTGLLSFEQLAVLVASQ